MELVEIDVLWEFSERNEEGIFTASVVEFSGIRSCGLLLGLLSCFCFE